MGLSNDIAALTGFACECVLWGAYCILFLISLGLLYRRTQCGHLNATLLVMHCLLFTTCTAHFALEFNHFYTTLRATGVPGFANETKPLAASDIFISISDLLGDAVLIYRCWFLWGDHRWIVLPLALPAIAGFGACSHNSRGLMRN
ncbi:hypothetical protein NUW54_g8712 [Trametes sanguinea]|uniref:Uncharacterized protein n=1 Tax=Trametes sanguinea TaxID=158606 RepID=A0ACC1PBC2_9APHY|nr:hypothetical protein NUW54_g8712 [Trametes sanguinea]